MDFIQTLLIACIPALIAAIISILVLRQQYKSYRRETMAERAAEHYLRHARWKYRKFETIKKHIGGWDKDEDKLRRILVKAGAIRIKNKKNEEMWGLLKRINKRNWFYRLIHFISFCRCYS